MSFNNQRIIQNELARLRQATCAQMPENPACHGWKSYCQCDEDGIINECLKRIAKITSLSNTFIEIGCGDGRENNTHQLLLNGYKGVWIDGSQASICYLAETLGGTEFAQLKIMPHMLTLANIANITESCCNFLNTKCIDFFCIDTDGNDLYLLQAALQVVKPKLICVEYNAKFPPPLSLCIKYNETHEWGGDDYYGASLQAWVDMLEDYRLICCSLSGVNAFFVHKDLNSQFTDYTVEDLYQPQRFWLALESLGHPPSLKWLRQTLNKTNA